MSIRHKGTEGGDGPWKSILWESRIDPTLQLFKTSRLNRKDNVKSTGRGHRQMVHPVDRRDQKSLLNGLAEGREKRGRQKSDMERLPTIP